MKFARRRDNISTMFVCVSVAWAPFPKYPLAIRSVFWEHCERVVLCWKTTPSRLFLLVMFSITEHLTANRVVLGNDMLLCLSDDVCESESVSLRYDEGILRL